MNLEQQEFIAAIKQAPTNEIHIKKTGREGINLMKHSHHQCQIVYTLSGTLHIQIDNTNYFVPEHHLAWIPGGVEHVLSSNNKKISLINFYCTLKSSTKNAIWEQFAVYVPNAFVMHNLRFIATDRTVIKQSKARHLYQFALSFFKLLPAINLPYSLPLQTLVAPPGNRLTPILEYIIKHACEEITIKQVAHHFGFSVRNLTRLLQLSDIRFTHYLQGQRVTRAIELFADRNKSMQQIAYDIGFNSSRSFNRVFKQITGVSPQVYCTQQRKELDCFEE